MSDFTKWLKNFVAIYEDKEGNYVHRFIDKTNFSEQLKVIYVYYETMNSKVPDYYSKQLVLSSILDIRRSEIIEATKIFLQNSTTDDETSKNSFRYELVKFRNNMDILTDELEMISDYIIELTEKFHRKLVKEDKPD